MAELIQLKEKITNLYGTTIKNIQKFELNLQAYFILKQVTQNNSNNLLNEHSSLPRITKHSFEEFADILAKEYVPTNKSIVFLKNYISTRLYLLHHFFIKNINNFSTEAGCKKLITELTCLNNSFLDLQLITSNYNSKLLCKYNLNKNDIVKTACNVLTNT